MAYFEPQQRSPSPHRFWCVISVSMPVFRFGVWKPISFSRGLPTSFHKVLCGCKWVFSKMEVALSHCGSRHKSGVVFVQSGIGRWLHVWCMSCTLYMYLLDSILVFWRAMSSSASSSSSSESESNCAEDLDFKLLVSCAPLSHRKDMERHR